MATFTLTGTLKTYAGDIMAGTLLGIYASPEYNVDATNNIVYIDPSYVTSSTTGTFSKVLTTGLPQLKYQLRWLSGPGEGFSTAWFTAPASGVTLDLSDVTPALATPADATLYLTGPAGPTGAAGTNGTNGVGVPVGGTTGQALVKNSATNYDTVWGTVTPTDATTLAKGIVQLAGDLGGTAAAPAVLKVNGINVGGTPTAGQVLTASSGTAAGWAAIPAGADATPTTKGIVQLAGDLGGTAASPTTPTAVHLAGVETVSGAKTFTGGVTVTTTDVTITDRNLILSSTTGTKIGTASTQKLGFFGALPVVQQGGTQDLGVTLSNLGLRSASSGYAIATSGNASVGSIDLGGYLTTPSLNQTAATLAIGTAHHKILCNTTTAAITVTLPTAVGVTGREYFIKKTSADANTVTIATTSAQTINGATTLVLTRQYEGVKVSSDGANWFVTSASRVHSHDTAHITTGTMATARLGSGTASASTYLRGDSTWATVAAGGAPAQLSFSTTTTWRMPSQQQNANQAPSAGTVFYWPIYIPTALTLTGWGFNVWTAGDASSTVQLGLYNDALFAPTTQVKAGTALATATTGNKSETFTGVALTAGPYWLALVAVAPTTAPALTTAQTSDGGWFTMMPDGTGTSFSAAQGNPGQVAFQTSTTLPATAAATYQTNSNGAYKRYAVWLRLNA